MKGRVKTYKEDKGYGFILGEDSNDYFAHISNLITPENLYTGALVSFEPNENEKGKFAKKIEMLQDKTPKFIAFGDARIKISNIKNYGINSTEKYFVKIFREEAESYLFSNSFPTSFCFVDTGKYAEINEIQYNNYCSGTHKKFVQTESGEIRQTEKAYKNMYINKSDLLKKNAKYLYVTTYQNDNYVFWEEDAPFNIVEKCNEIDKYMLG